MPSLSCKENLQITETFKQSLFTLKQYSSLVLTSVSRTAPTVHFLLVRRAHVNCVLCVHETKPIYCKLLAVSW